MKISVHFLCQGGEDYMEEDLKNAELKIKNRDKLIKDYQEEHEILLDTISRLKNKITDLENNIELLVNNLQGGHR